MYQGVDLNFSQLPVRREQTSPGPVVVGDGGDITALDVRVASLETIGAVYGKVRTVTATGDVAADDYLVLCDATGGAITLTLPAVAGSNGRVVVVKKVDVSANAVTIEGNGAETIDGALNESLAAQYDALTVICNGAAWWIA